MRLAIASFAILLLAASAGVQAQNAPAAPAPAPAAPRVAKFGLTPRPNPLTPWVAPNRPYWKLSEIKATHAGQARWTHTVVRDDHWTATFHQMAAGDRTKRLLYTDSEMFWVVLSGQMRVSVDGLDVPFIAGPSTIVQIPQNTFFETDVIGDAPVLRYEVTRTGMLPVYAAEETPTPLRGQRYVRVAIPGAPPKLDPAVIYLDFDKDVVGGKVRPGRFIRSGSLLRGMTTPVPPRDDLGHYHTETSEFYLIMEGQQDFQLEGAEPFIVEKGDVIYVPVGRFHRNSYLGGGMATRLAVFPTGNINSNDPENPSKQNP